MAPRDCDNGSPTISGSRVTLTEIPRGIVVAEGWSTTTWPVIVIPVVRTSWRLFASALISSGTRAARLIGGALAVAAAPGPGETGIGDAAGAAGFAIVVLAYSVWHPGVTPVISKLPFASAL